MSAPQTAYDVAVIGLGAMGSAVTYHLAKAGARVVGLDTFTPPHTSGSTHGHSRIIREAYFEDPVYVPLVRHAYRGWAALEAESGRTLFQRTGGLMIGLPESGLIAGTRASAREHDIAVTELDAAAIVERFPALRPERGMVGLLEHRAGVLDPEACVSAYLDLAARLGAELHFNCRALSMTPHQDAVQVETAAGPIIARRLVVAAGAWTLPLLQTAGLSMPLVVERQTMHWFTPHEASVQFDAGHLPITLIEYERDRYVYFIPDFGEGVKAAIHYDGEFVDAESVDRTIRPGDIAAVQPLVGRFAPGIAGTPRASAVCLYTNTPDKHFIVDELPGLPQVQVISACSGHGFKFASAIGEIVAGRALGDGRNAFDLRAFRATRWS